jgi:rhodanese-related sulfurtransferase
METSSLARLILLGKGRGSKKMDLRRGEISQEGLAQLMDRRTVMVIDVREPSEFEAERIAGAICFPLSDFDPARLPNDSKKLLVFHCGSGNRSGRALARARKAKLKNSCHLIGGLKGWKAAGLPTVKGDG